MKVKLKLLSPVPLFATPRTIPYQAPQSMEFSRQEYWSGVPLPSPGDLSNPGIEPGSPALQGDALPSEPPEKSNMKEARNPIDKWQKILMIKSQKCIIKEPVKVSEDV